MPIGLLCTISFRTPNPPWLGAVAAASIPFTNSQRTFQLLLTIQFFQSLSLDCQCMPPVTVATTPRAPSILILQGFIPQCTAIIGCTVTQGLLVIVSASYCPGHNIPIRIFRTGSPCVLLCPLLALWFVCLFVLHVATGHLIVSIMYTERNEREAKDPHSSFACSLAALVQQGPISVLLGIGFYLLSPEVSLSGR
jgi:hypothetical protein